MLTILRRCFAGAAVLAVASSCAQSGPRPDVLTPEIRGVLRPGDPYGQPDDVVPGLRVAVVLGESAGPCRPILAEAVSDSAGHFSLPQVSAHLRRGMAGTGSWHLCVGLSPDAHPSLPMYRGQGAGGGPLRLECEVHGDMGSPKCVVGRGLRPND